MKGVRRKEKAQKISSEIKKKVGQVMASSIIIKMIDKFLGEKKRVFDSFYPFCPFFFFPTSFTFMTFSMHRL